MTQVRQLIERMPKVELHVHLEGSIQPATLLQLAERNGVSLPARTVPELHEWYRFTDFAHFVEIYFATCSCIRTPDDFELIATEFLRGQARQNCRYSEVIFTPYTHGDSVPFDDQLAAINRARALAAERWGVSMGMVPDVSRDVRPVRHAVEVAEWAVANIGNGVVGFGIGGPEIDNPPELFTEAFEVARAGGLPSLPHAGETVGPTSIRGAIDALHAVRIGHGVRCLEDPELVELLRERQIPLDVSPTSNVCLGVAPSLGEHPLPRLLHAGLYVTINSDDPPMFGTTLTEEYARLADTLALGVDQICGLVDNAVQASLLAPAERERLALDFKRETGHLRAELGV